MARLRYHISSHGLGHASRSCRIINTLRESYPQIAVEVVTLVPDWFLEGSLDRSVPVFRPRMDAGLVQGNALEFDLRRTLESWREVMSARPKLLAEEERCLRERSVTLVAADIPAYPFAAAAEVGVPSVAVANFSWDWILDSFRVRHEGFGSIVEALRADYRKAGLLLRLPFHGDFPAFSLIADLPLVARLATEKPSVTRQRLRLPADGRLALIAFGGFPPPDLDLTPLSRLEGWTFLADVGLASRFSFLHPLPRGTFYPNLVAAADAVVTKPGYGIVSECLANDTAVLHVSRGDFPEQKRLVAGLKRFGREQEIDGDRLRCGEWGEALEELMKRPQPAATLATDGDEVAADRLADLAGAV